MPIEQLRRETDSDKKGPILKQECLCCFTSLVVQPHSCAAACAVAPVRTERARLTAEQPASLLEPCSCLLPPDNLKTLTTPTKISKSKEQDV